MGTETRLRDFESQEIADVILNVENEDEDSDVTEEALFEKWGINLEIFHEIVCELFKTMDFGLSPLTHEAFVGFAKNGRWLAKSEVNQQFIQGVILWATEGEDIPKGKKFVRTITSNGVPEYDVQISVPIRI